MTFNPRHHPSGWLRYGAAELRAAVAEDRRLRRKAERLGLRAEKSKSVGGWALCCGWSGLIQHGPRLFTWQAEAALDELLAQARAEGLL